jgi:hypothetical protein
LNSDELALDDQLEQLAAGITQRVRLDPPELKAKLLPPQLQVIKGPPGINSYCIPNSDGTRIIMIGADVYKFFHHFTRAAAAYFLQSEPGGPRPSPLWPKAREAVANTLNWISSPAKKPRYEEFELSPRQAHVAAAFAAYTFRFALCHEMAHVVLGHVESENLTQRRVNGEDVEFLRASQQQEFEADQMGLTIQIRSLPVITDLVTALVSPAYFVHITALLDARLMLLAHLVDPYHWKIARTHPPYLARLFPLAGEAARLYPGGDKGLMEVHSSLQPIQGEIFDAANKRQDAVVEAATKLLTDELARYGGRQKGKLEEPVTPKVREELLQLFEQSPCGVMRVLELDSWSEDDADQKQKDHELRSFVINRLVSVLPPEFQRFHGLSRAQRSQEIA